MPITSNPSYSSDTVSVLNNNSIQVFENARPIRLTVIPDSQFMIHPVQRKNGLQLVADQRILIPLEINIEFILIPESYRDTYQQIYNAYRSSINFFVQSKSRTYGNMFIKSIPHEENPRLYDTISMTISFQEVIPIDVTTQVLSSNEVLNPSDESTIVRGEQASTESTTENENSGSILFDVFYGN